MPSREELAEHTEALFLPRAGYEIVRGAGLDLVAGPRNGNLHPYAVGDVAAAVAWSREEARRRRLEDVEWWIGWRTTPHDLGERLLECGLARSDDPPTLVGLTCASPPPAEPAIEVRRVEQLADYAQALEVDWEAWDLSEEKRAQRREDELNRFAAIHATGTVHHFTGFLGGEPVGFGRAVDMDGAVALFGGAVVPRARHHGVYRALVRARWDHAVARGTPVLAVQAGPMSTPVLEGLGFARHGEIQLFVDRL